MLSSHYNPETQTEKAHWFAARIPKISLPSDDRTEESGTGFEKHQNSDTDRDGLPFGVQRSAHKMLQHFSYSD